MSRKSQPAPPPSSTLPTPVQPKRTPRARGRGRGGFAHLVEHTVPAANAAEHGGSSLAAAPPEQHQFVGMVLGSPGETEHLAEKRRSASRVLWTDRWLLDQGMQHPPGSGRWRLVVGNWKEIASGQTEKWENTSWPRSPSAKGAARGGRWLVQLSLRLKGGMWWLLVPRVEDVPPFGTEQPEAGSIAGCSKPHSRKAKTHHLGKGNVQAVGWGWWVKNQLQERDFCGLLMSILFRAAHSPRMTNWQH